MADILFVCVRKDLARADALAERLQSRGFSVGQLPASDAALNGSAAGVLLWSHAARQSAPFRETAHRVIRAGRAVFASLIRFPSPSVLGRSSNFDLSGWNGDPRDAALAPLCSAIEQKLGDRLCEQALHWRSIRQSRTASVFLDYIGRHGPEGAFCGLAEQRMKELAAESLRAALRKPPAPAAASAPAQAERKQASVADGGDKSACGVAVLARPAQQNREGAPGTPSQDGWVASISRTGPAFAPTLAREALPSMTSFDGDGLPAPRPADNSRAERKPRPKTDRMERSDARSKARRRRALAKRAPAARVARRVAAVLIPMVVGVALSGSVYFGSIANMPGLPADARVVQSDAGRVIQLDTPAAAMLAAPPIAAPLDANRAPLEAPASVEPPARRTSSIDARKTPAPAPLLSVAVIVPMAAESPMAPLPLLLETGGFDAAATDPSGVMEWSLHARKKNGRLGP